MIIPLNLNQPFICGYQFEDLKNIDDIVAFYEENKSKSLPGMVMNPQGTTSEIVTQKGGLVNTYIKDSLDLVVELHTIDEIPCIKTYMNYLMECVTSYIKTYDRADGNIVLAEDFNIQYYKPGGGFKEYHYEKDDGSEVIDRRHLVFMTYLNNFSNVENQEGGTEFLYQNFRVSPKKGLTLIWPATWPFTHRSIVSTSEEKYIVTGWLHKVPIKDVSITKTPHLGTISYE